MKMTRSKRRRIGKVKEAEDQLQAAKNQSKKSKNLQENKLKMN